MDAPLAHILRPKTIEEFAGQKHLVGQGMPITQMLKSKSLHSMILWGPPGCGKTTLAHLIAKEAGGNFITLSAIESGAADVKRIIAQARKDRAGLQKQQTILFIDEIHRFNKVQQDSLLSAVETGDITLIGATTENPGFEVIAPLLSRCQIYILYSLALDELSYILARAKKLFPEVELSDQSESYLLQFANGDARKLLNAFQIIANAGLKKISPDVIADLLQKKLHQYDKSGDAHYDTSSAFIKSMRGNQPDAALHYLARMIEAGEDPIFIARRMVVFASEDISNAQPTALVVATACMQAVHMIGYPEASIILAQCATYLATAKKSTASYDGLHMALSDLKNMPVNPIPLHLRNPANSVMKAAGYGKGHIRYPWKEEKGGKKVNQEYMPENLVGKKYYQQP
jgi:putative ATPase